MPAHSFLLKYFRSDHDRVCMLKTLDLGCYSILYSISTFFQFRNCFNCFSPFFFHLYTPGIICTGLHGMMVCVVKAYITCIVINPLNAKIVAANFFCSAKFVFVKEKRWLCHVRVQKRLETL